MCCTWRTFYPEVFAISANYFCRTLGVLWCNHNIVWFISVASSQFNTVWRKRKGENRNIFFNLFMALLLTYKFLLGRAFSLGDLDSLLAIGCDILITFSPDFISLLWGEIRNLSLLMKKRERGLRPFFYMKWGKWFRKPTCACLALFTANEWSALLQERVDPWTHNITMLACFHKQIKATHDGLCRALSTNVNKAFYASMLRRTTVKKLFTTPRKCFNNTQEISWGRLK